MTKPNENEKDLAKKTLAFLRRADVQAKELNLYMVCNERGESYLANGNMARVAIAKAIEELSKITGLPAEEPTLVEAAEG